MAKVSGPLFSNGASGPFAKVLDYTKDGHVRQERHIAPPKTPGVATSRAIMKAINGVSKQISNTRRQELEDAFTDPQNWASTIATQTIGEQRAAWLNDEILWSLLDAGQQQDWNDRAIVLHVPNVTIVDTLHNSHNIAAGQALYHVSLGVSRCSLPGAPTQPSGTNAQTWADYLADSQPTYPVNVLVLNLDALLLGAELLTLS